MTPNTKLDNNGWVAGFVAQIDSYNVVLEKVLLFPSNELLSGQGGPYTWGSLLTNQFAVPYQAMLTAGTDSSSNGIVNIPNAVQYLYQEDPNSDAYLSPWFQFALTGTPWVQPNPNWPPNSKYLAAKVWNPLREIEESGETTITNDYFSWDSTNKAYWITFHIHTDSLNVGDKVHPYFFANGFIIDTDTRVSLWGPNFPAGGYTVTATNGVNDVIKVDIPANPLVTIASGSGNNYGQLDFIYFVNQTSWSSKFKAPTQFDPDNLDPPKEALLAAK
ncbi:hypothetical protein DUT91_03540 [Phyllobacterium salinisoli]|uniref:Uncharacterized protein n=2 Tax=Phyllobacterium salinisoli TaxID=1899321 RepID=A0A368K9E3_9HYPH|nr:hypothetical protein DUT91_03540 [Phyllobacterium salinisoli]